MAANRRNFIGADGVVPPFKYFFKAISPEAIRDQKLMIPEKFALVFKDKLPDVAMLKGPDGGVWIVRLTKERGSDRRVWLDSGFGDFLRFHSIVARDLLMFKYDGSSGFKVVICDDAACEVVFPDAEPQVSSGEEDDDDDMDDSELDSYDESSEEEDAVELSDSESESLNPGRNLRSANGKRKEVETGNIRSGGEASGSRRRLTGPTTRAAGTAAARQGDKGKRRRLSVEDSDSSSDDDWEAGRGQAQRVATGDGASSSRQRRTRSNASGSTGDLWRRLVASKISHILDLPNLSQGSKKAVKEAIDCSNSNRPSVLIVMKTQHIARRALYVPTKFAREHFGEEPEGIRLLAYEGKMRLGSETLARSVWQGSTLFFRKWAEFRSSNDLAEDDVCLFELVDKKNKVFNIFRAR